MALNKELLFLAKAVGIKDARKYRSNSMLSGAIFIKIELLKEYMANQQMTDRLKK